MALTLSIVGPVGGGALTYSVRIVRATDGYIFDFAGTAFVLSGGTQTTAIPEVTAYGNGVYFLIYGPTPQSTWANLDYIAYMVDSGNNVVAQAGFTMVGGTSITPANIALLSGITVAGSTNTSVRLSGLPSGKTWAVTGGATNQKLYHPVSGEARIIATQTVSGSDYIFTFGGGTAEAGPFSAAPGTGEPVAIIS